MLTERIRAVVLWSLVLICCGSSLLAQQSKANPPAPAQGAFTPEIAVKLLDQMLQGLESRNQTRFLSVFDSQLMPNYGEFSNQVDVLFTQYDNFVGRYRVLEWGNNSDQPLVLVQFDLQAQPASFGSTLRKSAQVRFEFGRGRRGWSIVNITPRGFFSS